MQLGRNPIIVGGCARSGTTLLLSLFSCHPHIYGIDFETRAFCPSGYSNNPNPNDPFKLKKLYDFLLCNTIPTTCTRWCEKTPRNVFSYARILQYFGSRVRIINIVRDGRDVITSKHPSKPEEFWVSPERWVTDVNAGLQYRSHRQVKTIQYEDLINDYEATIESVYHFIDEPYDKASMSYPGCTPVQQYVAWFDKAKRLSSTSIGRWKKPKYDKRVKLLLDIPKAIELLEYYGYK